MNSVNSSLFHLTKHTATNTHTDTHVNNDIIFTPSFLAMLS